MMVRVLGINPKPVLAGNIATFRRSKKKKASAKDAAIGAAKLYGAYQLGSVALRSGVPRALGVRLESHSTSKKTAKAILKGGGYLDPNYSGKASIGLGETAPGNEGFEKRAGGQVYITGYHPDARTKTVDSQGNIKEGPPLKDNPLRNVGWRKLQRGIYGTQAEVLQEKPLQKFENIKDPVERAARLNQQREEFKQRVVKASQEGKRGKTLYVAGDDRYYRENFKPDFDDPIALRTTQKVKVYGNRAAATAGFLKQKGVRGTLDAMNQNKGRVLTGAIVAGAGGYGAYRLGKSGLSQVRQFLRRNKSGKMSWVKGFKRKFGKRKKGGRR